MGNVQVSFDLRGRSLILICMNDTTIRIATFGKWMALTAALLGWLFDGLEMGLFPLVARPSLVELGVHPDDVITWLGVITALFLVGAATGGVLFGWLGDRIGRVRSMMLSVLVYALFSGSCGFARAPWQIGVLRFVAALGMGGEWSLGVALINEIWPGRSRAFLAGLIGAAANVGYFLIALIGRNLTTYVQDIQDALGNAGLAESSVLYLIGQERSGWRILMMVGAVPALLTFFIRLFVPESQRWEQERDRGSTSHFANRDLLAVLAGSFGACGIVAMWSPIWPTPLALEVQIAGTLIGLFVVTVGYVFPVYVYLRRATIASDDPNFRWQPIIGRMLLAACLSGVALLGTWGTTQQAPTWADQVVGKAERCARSAHLISQASGAQALAQSGGPMAAAAHICVASEIAESDVIAFGHSHPALRTVRSDTLIWLSIGAIVGTILAALIADYLGRRMTYTLLCLASFAVIPALFLGTSPFDWYYLPVIFAVGAITASFYGWLPLYLPELFPTRVRATGQGFGFNFGRVIAAVGVLQLGNFKELFKPYGWGDPQVYTMLSGIYIVGMILIWFAPETKGKPLPE
jgi:MFS transporter, SHS family, sialic acid transporter